MRKVTFLKTILLAIVLVVGSAGAWGQIAAWQLNGKAGNETSIDASTLNSNLNTSTLMRGNGLNVSALANVFGSTNFTVSGTKADAITNNKYITFNINAKSGFQVSLSTLDVRFRRSGTGPNAFQWQYSLDGSTFTDLSSVDISYTSTTTGGDAQTQINLSSITALQNVSSSTSIIFRLYGWGATATTGTFGIGRSLTSGATDYSLAIGGSVNAVGGTATPAFSPSAGTYTSAQNITLSSATSNAKIYYTADGVTTPSSASTLYTTPIALNSTATTTIQAIAYDASDANPSSVASATYTINLNPTINSSPSTLSAFSAVVGTPYSKTLTVSGTNLTADISATLDDATQFQVSPATVTQSDGTAASTTVTVTYNPTAAGTHTTTLTLNSGSATPFTYSLSGTATWPPLDTPVATAATSVSATGLTANWNTVSNATEYTLNVYTKSGTKLSEGFDNMGSSGTPVPTDWTFTNIGSIYSSSSTGYFNVAAPSLKFDATGDIVITPTYSTPATSISFWIRGAATDATSALLVEGSTDGSTWSIIENINPLPTSGTLKTYNSESTPALVANLVKFRFTYTKSAGNLAFDDFVFDHNYLETPISGSPFTGITDLTKTLTSLVSSTAYYYTVTANNTHVTSSASNEITAITAINSSVVASTFADCPTCDVTIANGGTLTVDASKTYKSLTIDGGGKVTLDDTKTLSITNDFFINSDETNGTGTFVDENASGGLTVSGTSNVQQYLSDDGRQWWYLSSPVAGATSALFGSDKVGQYNEATTSYTSPFNTATELIAGTGYVIKRAVTTAGTYTFEGTLNNGDITLTPTRTGTTAGKRGFNLVGNPYPSYLEWDAVYVDAATSNIRNAIWYRTYSGGSMTFYTYSDGDGVPSTVTGIIPPAQAFWLRVDADGSNGSITFKNTHRSHAGATANPLKAPAINSRPRIRLQVSNGVNSDEALIVAKSYTTNGIDSYDIEKMENDNVDIPEIYSLLNNQEMVINSLNSFVAGQEISLGFRPGRTGEFSITSTQFENIPSDLIAVLKDQLTGVETELGTGVSYSFSSDATPSDSRFVVSFRSPGSNTGTDIISNKSLLVYAQNSQIIISSTALTGSKITVYSTTGQIVFSGLAIVNREILKGNFTPGVYLVKVNDIVRKLSVK
jgi:trimeric autotransporter adhesin